MSTDTRTRENVETQRRFVTTVWNDRQFDAIPEFVAPNAVVTDPTQPEPIYGPDEYEAYVRATVRAFPDFRIEQHAVVGEDDRVMSHYTLTGTHDGPFDSLPPTGRRVEIEGMASLRYADGRIVEDHAFVDTTELRRQLGLTLPTALVTVPRLAVRAVRTRV